MSKRLKKFNLFSERVLVVLISLVTLFLQIISFATTWDGAKVYLDGVFPYASLLFAVAIQTTAYFFSNSLRSRKSILTITALCVVICCSTYYSYIGIYNSVNSPLTYMQEKYTQIEDTLTTQYNLQMEARLDSIQKCVLDTISQITTRHRILCTDLDHAYACQTKLDAVENDISTGMRAPKQSAYENYEDYLAAYKAYISAQSSGNNLEQSESREGILASYGFSDLEELNKELSELTGKQTTLYSILNIDTPEELGSTLSSLSMQITTAIHNATPGGANTNQFQNSLNTLLQAASLLELSEFSVSEMTSTLEQCASLSSAPLMASYEQLAGKSPQLKDALSIKGSLDSEISSALLKINKLFPENRQILLTEEIYQITNLYLIPVRAFTADDTRLTALFCLAMAGLVDGLSVLFAISIRRKKPLWNKRLLPIAPMDERYISQIYAALPPDESYVTGFRSFLHHFIPSPETESQGYMLRASLEEISAFSLLVAVLCQINLAKIVIDDSGKEHLLLKAVLVFWVNDIIFQEMQENGGTS